MSVLSNKRKEVFERDNYICKYCGKILDERTATLDHVNPRWRSKDNSVENLVTACFKCNNEKGMREQIRIY